MSVLKIDLDAEEKKQWENALLRYLKRKYPYMNANQHKADIQVKLQRAINGWEGKRPRSFECRLKQVFSIQNQDFSIYFVKDGELGRYRPPQDALQADEKEYLNLRREYYTDEYDLDNYGDQALLEIVLLEELRLYRIKNDLEKNPSLRTDYSDHLGKTRKNLVDALKALGITREQRQLEQKIPKGSVANLSAKFEEKLKEMKKIREEDLKDERLLLKYKAQKEAVNKIVESDIEGILRIIEARKEILE